VIWLTSEIEVPVKNNYSTPHTLGMDRLAGVVGAFQLYPGTNCLVVDAGTTITCDFLDEEGHYQGGSITPGIDMRFKSLSEYTDKLPLVESDWDSPPFIGNNTEGSIRSGVLNGVVSEIEGIIRRYDHKFSNLKVIICGGDAQYFESRLKDSIFAPHLVLIGLNSILMYHVQNK
jgi:type III pantothenate kinase